MEQAAAKLSNIFQDVNFAWQLLNAEIQIEMSHIVPGDVIAYLLQLYMRGVERMNSLGDPRESYFKNKVTCLMTKQTVIKSLKENPMKKKSKPLQLTAKQQPKKQTSQPRQKTPKKKKAKKQELKELQKELQTVSVAVPTLNPLQLKEKRLELQKRMAYVAQQHGPDSLKKIIAEEDNREQNISSKISKIINSHEQRLNERIKARKLRTTTFRTRSQVNIQEAQMMQPTDYYQGEAAIQIQNISPFLQIALSEKKIEQTVLQGKAKKVQQSGRRCKSLEYSRAIQSPQKKIRKYTFDEANPSKENFPPQ